MQNQPVLRVHHFRALTSPINDNSHNGMPGCHGQNPKWCRACVSVVVVVIDFNDESDKCNIGIAYRNPSDQFNRKIARRIAIGRAKKDLQNGIFYSKTEVKDLIDRSYISENFTITSLKNTWHNFYVDGSIV